MIIRDLFIVLTDEQEKLLMDKYKDEVMLKTVLRKHLDEAISNECNNIIQEKAEKLLNQDSKL